MNPVGFNGLNPAPTVCASLPPAGSGYECEPVPKIVSMPAACPGKFGTRIGEHGAEDRSGAALAAV
jgi:hypothetical protein